MANFKQLFINEKPALIFLLKLLILLCLIKTIFFFYNYHLYNGWEIHNFSDALKVISWSLYYDALMISIVALPVILGSYIKKLYKPLAWLSVLAIILMLLLNIADIFYFRFHRQRADNDLFYVIRNPFNYGSFAAWILMITVLLFIFFSGKYLYKILHRLSGPAIKKPFHLSLVLIILIISSLFVLKGRTLIPTAPLTSIKAEQLPVAQNSLHSFLYSVFRNKESVLPANHFMDDAVLKNYFSINRKPENVADSPKNIVLFIMESVPYEFFDSSVRKNFSLPFLDSLLQHSTYFNNAFSFSYASNKGITAILSGLPTIIDIPLFHSGYINISKTSIGQKLAHKGYNSAFYIGDNYDDFGFAKAAQWFGIKNYNSMEKIEGYKKLEHHTMGLHDEYTLGFMQQQIKNDKTPFFNCFYNISTHYPNDLPQHFKKQTENIKFPAPYKSMLYYDECLKNFFANIQNESWFSNTVFIFCSDHWASPDYSNAEDKVNSFRIPIFIFDPSVNKKEAIPNNVSQLDIMNTILAYAGIKDSIISYGNSLTDAGLFNNRTVFTKKNDAVYQAINNQYVLGLNADNGEVLYCYNYQSDKERKINLWPSATPAIDELAKQMKAFLQTASNHYKNKNVSTK